MIEMLAMEGSHGEGQQFALKGDVAMDSDLWPQSEKKKTNSAPAPQDIKSTILAAMTGPNLGTVSETAARAGAREFALLGGIVVGKKDAILQSILAQFKVHDALDATLECKRPSHKDWKEKRVLRHLYPACIQISIKLQNGERLRGFVARTSIDLFAAFGFKLEHPDIAVPRGYSWTSSIQQNTSDMRTGSISKQEGVSSSSSDCNREAVAFGNGRPLTSQFFEAAAPAFGDGVCSDNACPCPNTVIPRLTGYLYISQELVEFRSKYPSQLDAQQAMESELERKLAALGISGKILYSISPILMCERGARLRNLDLETAAKDAQYWWATGLVPLRATPLARSRGQTLSEPDQASTDAPSCVNRKVAVVSDDRQRQRRIAQYLAKEFWLLSANPLVPFRCLRQALSKFARPRECDYCGAELLVGHGYLSKSVTCVERLIKRQLASKAKVLDDYPSLACESCFDKEQMLPWKGDLSPKHERLLGALSLLARQLPKEVEEDTPSTLFAPAQITSIRKPQFKEGNVAHILAVRICRMKSNSALAAGIAAIQGSGGGVIGLLSPQDLLARADAALKADGSLIEFGRGRKLDFEDIETMTGSQFVTFARQSAPKDASTFTWGCGTDLATYAIAVYATDKKPVRPWWKLW